MPEQRISGIKKEVQVLGAFFNIMQKGKALVKRVRKETPQLSPAAEEKLSIEIPIKPFPAIPPPEWQEQDINRWLKNEFFSRGRVKNQKDWTRFIRYVSLELEKEQRVRLIVMTRFYVRSYIEAELIDIWHDHRTSGLALSLKSVTLFGIPFLPQFLTRWLTPICMGIAGVLFNPVLVREGVFLRFSAENLRIDLHHNFRLSQYSGVYPYLWDETGKKNNSFVIFGAKTDQGKLRPKIKELSIAWQEKCHSPRERCQNGTVSSIFRSEDVWPLLIVAVIAGYAVQFLRPYLAADMMVFSLSWSFLASLFMLFASMAIVNVARWVYQVSLQAKRKPIKFQAEEMHYRIDRIRRDIELEMQELHQESVTDSLEEKLFRAGQHRSRALRLEEKLEVLNRELKLKYGLAYIVTVLSEYISFRFWG